MADPTNAEIVAAMKAALERWNALPDDERNGERPWIMGWNDGFEHAQEEIERLAAEVERYRAALAPFAKAADLAHNSHITAFVYVSDLRAARQALAGKEGSE